MQQLLRQTYTTKFSLWCAFAHVFPTDRMDYEIESES